MTSNGRRSIEKRRRDNINCPTDLIPALSKGMPALLLGAPVTAPEEFVLEIARAVQPSAAFTDHGVTGLRTAHHGKRLVASVHPITRETNVYPTIENLSSGKHLARLAASTAERIRDDRSLFPEDVTEVVPLSPVTLFGAHHKRGKARSRPAEYLSYVRFERHVDGLAVYGPGSTALIGVGSDGTIRAFAHRWRPALGRVGTVSPHSRTAVRDAILDQLAPSAAVNNICVDRVTVGYFHADGDLLQPVFRFEATVSSPDSKVVANRHLFGYVSIGAAPEPLPVLGVPRGNDPVEPSRGKRPARARAPRATVRAADPTVGRYVVRDDSPDWVSSANNFMSNLQAAQAWFGGIEFTDSQYYWAEPFEFLSDKNAFVNSVQVALNEVHGNWWRFSTRDNHDDIVDLTSIPAGGYGTSSGGSLAYWILHSCEVIPTQTDESTSFDVWWNIFDGLHAAVGYRTEMWIDDGVTGPFGFAIGLGAPVVSTWITKVVGDSSYNPDATYTDSNRNITEPMGRPSAVAVHGHGDDTVADVDPLPAATSLSEWWISN